uniref:Uncharacterized protein n=1 Tax=Fopius arisanus TaxID=64838 RepID=A0A0C9R6T4_9HYME
MVNARIWKLMRPQSSDIGTKKFDSNGKLEILRIPALMDIVPQVSFPPKSRWEEEEESKRQEDHLLQEYVEEVLDKAVERVTTPEKEKIADVMEEGEIEEEVDEEMTGGLVSEYEEFMKMVSTEPETSPKDSSLSQEMSSVKESRDIVKTAVYTSKEIEKMEKIEEDHHELPFEDSEGKKITLPKGEAMKISANMTVEGEQLLKSPETPRMKEFKSHGVETKSHKKSSKKKTATSTETSDSSSSDSEYERRKRKRKRQRKKRRSRDSSSSSSSSDDSSSEDSPRRRRKTFKKQRKHKKLKLRRKKSRRDSSDSDSSSSPERSLKRKRKKKKVVKRSKTSNREDSRSSETQKLQKIKKEIEEEDMPLEKNSISITTETSHETEPQYIQDIVIKIEKDKTPSVSEQEDGEINEEIDENQMESSEFQLEKDQIHEQEMTDPEKIALIPIPEGAHPLEALRPEEIPLPSAPEPSRDIHLPPDDTLEEELLEKKREIELELLRTRKSPNRHKKRRSVSTSSTSSSTSSSSYSSSSSSVGESATEKNKSHSKKSHSRRKSSERVKKPRKYLTEFDFDFPSLTQLEQGRGTLIDDWEVDSMEAVNDLLKDKSKKHRKIEKEVKYDEKTDTYIAVEKEMIKENKKKLSGRVCLRIWEDEEEEGEREALLMETVNPGKKTADAAVIGTVETSLADLKTKETIKSNERMDKSEEREDTLLGTLQDLFTVKEKSAGVRKAEWESKSSELSIATDPPTPEGPLVPVNWEEEEEWTSSLNLVDVRPVPPATSESKLEPLSFKPELKTVIEKIGDLPEEKDHLYSPSSPADSHKSEPADDISESSESTSETSSSESSSEPPDSPKTEPIKDQVSRIHEIESSTPPLVLSPKTDDFLLGKSPEDPSKNVLHQLKQDMFSKLRDQEFDKIQKDSEASVALKKSPKMSSEGGERLTPRVSPVESLLKTKEVFMNTFVEITPQTSRSSTTPDRRKISPRDSDKAKPRISEERTSNSSHRSNKSSVKEPEKLKTEERSRRDCSHSPRRRSPDRRHSEKRRSPSWKRRHSRSRSRSWSRSRSRSPSRRDRQRRFKHAGEGRERYSPGRLRGRERRERDWSLEKSSDKTYDPLEIFRGSKRFAETRRVEAPREAGNSQDVYDIRPLLELTFDDRDFQRESLDREMNEEPVIPSLCPELELKCRNQREWDHRESERVRRRSPGRRSPLRRSPVGRSPGRRSPGRRSPGRRSPGRRSPGRRSPGRRSPVRRSPERRRERERKRSPRRERERERDKFVPRSGSRSWTKSRSRSPIRSRSPLRSRSRDRSASRERSRSSRQSLERTRRRSRSRSLSPRRRRREERFRSSSGDRGRKIETIVHPPGMNPPAPEEGGVMANEGLQAANFRYQPDQDFAYFPSNNLTYPPRVEDSSGSPKRLSLDDRLELELGIKKSQEIPAYRAAIYPHMMAAGSIPLPPHPGPVAFHRPPTVLQVGNVLQVVPRDYQPAGVPPVNRSDIPPSPVPSAANGNRVLRVGNVLQVVPTTNLDWTATGPTPVGMDRPPPVYPTPPVASVPSSPHPLPVPLPQVSTPTPLPRLTVPKPPPVPQPVYNYEAIIEARKKEKDERRKLRAEKRNEKENRRIIRMRKRAEKILDKVSRGNETVEETSEISEDVSKLIDEEEEESVAGTFIEATGDVKEFGGDFDEDEEVDLEGDVDEDDEEDEIEESEEEQEDEESKLIPALGDLKECKSKVDVEGDLGVLPAPKKGILVPPGQWANRLLNGDAEEEAEKIDAPEVSVEGQGEIHCEALGDNEVREEREEREKKLRTRRARRKAVQFADGVKPGEGTSPSGGEGDMPSPPPPASASINDPVREMVKKRMRKRERKKPKRVKAPKTKKKVKVKIIKLKKPRITPLTALMLDDSDEMDDRSPPPPPSGSPPPPHLWPSYLAAYSATLKTVEPDVSPPSATQSTPPPTPLPLLVPPPPLNYTIQPLNKA